MPAPASTDRKGMMKRVLHEWWFSHGGENRYRTLKNFAEEIGILEDSLSAIWRGRRFPDEKNYAKLAAVVPLNEIASNLGHPVFDQSGANAVQRDALATTSDPIPTPVLTDDSLHGSTPSAKSGQSVVLGLPMIRWNPASAEALTMALRRWWEAEGVYEFGNRNQLSRSLQKAFPECNPSSVTWLRWFNGTNAPVNERQVAFVNDVVRGFERWGFDPRERTAVELPEHARPFLHNLTLASPISAILKKDAPPIERCDEAVRDIRVYQANHGMAFASEMKSSSSTVHTTSPKHERSRPRALAKTMAPASPQEAASETASTPDFGSGKALEALRAEMMSLRAELRSVERDLAMGAYTGGFEIGKRSEGLRFVVTSDSFRPISVAPSAEDIQDTERLIDELLRRFEVFAGHPSEAIRSATQAQLQRRSKALLVSVTRFLSQWSEHLNKMLDMYRDTLNNLPNDTTTK